MFVCRNVSRVLLATASRCRSSVRARISDFAVFAFLRHVGERSVERVVLHAGIVKHRLRSFGTAHGLRLSFLRDIIFPVDRHAAAIL